MQNDLDEWFIDDNVSFYSNLFDKPNNRMELGFKVNLDEIFY